MESQSDECDYVPFYDRPSKGKRLRRSITARLGRKRIKRVRALIQKREERTSEKRLRSLYRKTCTRFRY